MTLRSWMLGLGCAIFGGALGAQAQVAPNDRSSTLNNSANRAAEQGDKAADDAARFAAVPGGPATPRKDWKKGDPRGKPQNPAQAEGRRGRRHSRRHPKKKRSM